jgi:hypothetical protein
MKNLLIGIIIGAITSLWAYYFFIVNPKKISQQSFNLVPSVTNTVEPTAAITMSPSIEVPPPIPDSDLIKLAFSKKYNKPLNDITLNIKSNTGSLAQGSVIFAGENGGAWWLAAKKDSSWIIVQDGNGIVTCELITPYHFPASMVPECVDKNGNIIKL